MGFELNVVCCFCVFVFRFGMGTFIKHSEFLKNDLLIEFLVLINLMS